MEHHMEHQTEHIVIGVTFDAVDEADRHLIAFDESNSGAVRAALARIAPEMGQLIVSTCHRTELVLTGASLDIERARELWATMTPVSASHEHIGVDAGRHLFRVACGLESPMLGDSEIMGQFRSAWRSAALLGTATAELDLLMRRTLEAGARARTDTEISVGGAGLAGAVHTLVAAKYQSGSCLLVGAGPAGRSVARRLAKHRIGPLVIANRSVEAAQKLAREVGGRAIGLEVLGGELPQAEVVVVAVSAPKPIIDLSVLADSDQRPSLVIDVGALPGVERRGQHPDAYAGTEVVRLDDLSSRRDALTARRIACVPAVERLIAHRLDSWQSAIRAAAEQPLGVFACVS